MKKVSERKQQVIAMAEKLFSRKGYLATSVRDLANELDIEAASLYSHVKSKEELLWTIADRSAKAFFDSVLPLTQQSLPVKEKLTQMIIAHVQVIADHIEASAVFFREWKHLGEEKRAAYSKTRAEYEQAWRDVVKKGMEEGTFAAYDEGFSARIILSAINSTHTWYQADGPKKPREIGQDLASFLLNGLVQNNKNSNYVRSTHHHGI